ncbi:hypothetical protein Sps_04676 [Shewanella psychrophila]|uniref:Bacteriophage CII protein n=1 Tax=Shewanella psychrophila TaxID=225848 RepID=A0A1S6HW85_9GAMM|nr:hypothetical protein [Shewanella psychrophila]AQS39759.1 hypothetical protein Sps_04676 [Shewanella psychrophila]
MRKPLALELFELSGMSKSEFCKEINISPETLAAWSVDDHPGIINLCKAMALALNKHKFMTRKDHIDKKITQAKSILICVGESEELEQHHKVALELTKDIISNLNTLDN